MCMCMCAEGGSCRICDPNNWIKIDHVWRKTKSAMKVYEFGDTEIMEEPIWIRTNRKIRLSSAAKRSGRYLREVDISGNAAGVDLVIT